MVEWTPKVEGKHEMNLLVGGEYVNSTPISISVLDPSAVRVIGLRNERVGTEIQFNSEYQRISDRTVLKLVETC